VGHKEHMRDKRNNKNYCSEELDINSGILKWILKNWVGVE